MYLTGYEKICIEYNVPELLSIPLEKFLSFKINDVSSFSDEQLIEWYNKNILNSTNIIEYLNENFDKHEIFNSNYANNIFQPFERPYTVDNLNTIMNFYLSINNNSITLTHFDYTYIYFSCCCFIIEKVIEFIKNN